MKLKLFCICFTLFFLVGGFKVGAVEDIQHFLLREGYRVGEVDGIIGSQTKDAIVAFQKMHGLPQREGEIDEETRIAFRHIRRPEPKLENITGIHLEVSIARQLLYVFRDGRIESIIHVSTGREDRTPVGIFEVYQKVNTGWVDAISRTGEVQGIMYSPIKFFGPYYIHGSNYVPSYPDSLGCVRVNPWHMYYLHQVVNIGTKVKIY